MKTAENTVYRVTGSTSHQVTGNLIVKELSANVSPLTFSSKDGILLADLYKSVNSVSELVGSGSCAPVNSVFVKTVKIKF